MQNQIYYKQLFSAHWLAKGLEKAQDGKYKDAIESLQEAINRDPKYIDAYLSLAGVYGQIKNRAQSVATYEKAFAIDSNYTSDYRLPYSINVAGLGEFEKALATINALLSRNNLSPNTRKAATYRQKTYQFAIDYAKNEALSDYVFQPNNLGDGVNTSESEYLTVYGTASIVDDRSKIAALWSPMAKAWFQGGKDDPDLTLIKVTPESAYYWEPKQSKMVTLFKMAASAVSGKQMEIGKQGRIEV